jgi:hypothetical protein
MRERKAWIGRTTLDAFGRCGKTASHRADGGQGKLRMRHIWIFGAALALMGCNGNVDRTSFIEGVDGLRCSTQVLRVSDTGEAIDGDPVAELRLSVVAPGAARPFEATVDATVPRATFPCKGDALAVACDPTDPDRTQLIE